MAMINSFFSDMSVHITQEIHTMYNITDMPYTDMPDMPDMPYNMPYTEKTETVEEVECL